MKEIRSHNLKKKHNIEKREQSYELKFGKTIVRRILFLQWKMYILLIPKWQFSDFNSIPSFNFSQNKLYLTMVNMITAMDTGINILHNTE